MKKGIKVLIIALVACAAVAAALIGAVYLLVFSNRATTPDEISRKAGLHLPAYKITNSDDNMDRTASAWSYYCYEIAQKLAESDALIVGSPVYYGQPNGGILAVMQRLFYSAGHLVQNKPAAAVAICRRGGATAALQTMNMMFEMMNMPVVTSQYWNIAYGAGKGEAKMDKEGMQTMRTLGKNMAWLLQRIGDGPAPERDERPEFTNFIR